MSVLDQCKNALVFQPVYINGHVESSSGKKEQKEEKKFSLQSTFSLPFSMKLTALVGRYATNNEKN